MVAIHDNKYTGMSRVDLLEHYERIIEISQQLSSTFYHMALLRKIINAAKNLIHTEAASILLLDNATGQLRFELASNIKEHEREDIIVPLEGSIAGWIVQHGEPRVVEDVSQTTLHFPGVDSAIQFHTRNVLGVPLRTHEKVIGVLQAVNKLNRAEFTDDDIMTMLTLASQAGIAIENARLFQQNDFIAELVHELRNPLAALKVSMSLVQRTEIAEDKRKHILNTMGSEVNRLIDLTNDFLNIARLESGRERLNTSQFVLLELVEESIEIVINQANDKQITIGVEVGDLVVRADRGKIKQVILNLLTNAIKYNRPGGKIRIYAEVLTDQEEPYVRLAVEDTGYGIPKEHQKNMFQKFYRVPSLQDIASGTGLGLAITKHVIEAHGGHIWVESEEGIGSTFFFTLPELAV